MINKRNNDISFYDKNGNKSINTKSIVVDIKKKLGYKYTLKSVK